MGQLLYQFTLIRPLETDLQAFNVGVGMEQHYGLFVKFEDAVKDKLSGDGLEEAMKAFEKLDKMFKETIVLFKGEPRENEEKGSEELVAHDAE